MDERHIRQTLLIAPEVKRATIVIVGLGMLGSWTAQVLSRMAREVHGWDFDEVAVENIGTQAYDFQHIGQNKAVALAEGLIGLPFYSQPWKFTGDKPPQEIGLGNLPMRPLIVVSAVDSFAARRMVALWAGQYADLFIDTRAHGTVGVVYVVRCSEQVAPMRPAIALSRYLESLEVDGANAPAPACGAEGTAFVGMWVAQQVASSINRYYRDMPTAYKVVQDVGMDSTIYWENLDENPEQKSCTECGCELESSRKACPRCGFPVDGSVDGSAAAELLERLELSHYKCDTLDNDFCYAEEYGDGLVSDHARIRELTGHVQSADKPAQHKEGASPIPSWGELEAFR